MHSDDEPLLTRNQELILKTAFASSEGFDALWLNCLKTIQPNRLGLAATRLLPLLYPRIPRESAEALTKKVYQQYVRTKLNNTLLLKELTRIDALFKDEDIPIIVLKGANVIPRYYPDLGMRYMSDIDLMTPKRHFEKSIEVFQKRGYALRQDQDAFHFDKGVNLTSPQKVQIDLHHALFRYALDDSVIDHYWDQAEPMASYSDVKELALRQINPTDMFLHICAHGVSRHKKIRHLRWVADALLLLRKDECNLSWERLLDITEKQGVASELEISLAYLKRNWQITIPDTVILQIQKLSSDPKQLRVQARYVDSNETNYMRILGGHWYDYSTALKGQPLSMRLRLTRSFLLHWCKVDRLFKVPYQLFQKATKKLKQRDKLNKQAFLGRPGN